MSTTNYVLSSIYQHCLVVLVAMYLAVVNSGEELIAAHGELRPVVAVHPLPCVVQMLEVMGRHCLEGGQRPHRHVNQSINQLVS